uniref:Uncharacterized protein n=1 Tax=Ditylenchus dipsaci TaxID=166011 RepID=A0A915DFJ1_9BILA
MLPEHFNAQINDGNRPVASNRSIKVPHLKTISLVEARCDRAVQEVGGEASFLPGDYVYVRGLNIPCEKGGFLRGLVSEVCWEPSTQFPYRVHVETLNGAKRELTLLNAHNDEQFGVDGIWPTEESPSFWVSAYDVCSSSMELGIKRQPQYGSKFNSFYCSCSDNCSLFASENCSNAMSKACCDSLTKKCGYHEFYDPKNMPKVANRRANLKRVEDGTGESTSEETSKPQQNGSSSSNQHASTTNFLQSPSSSPMSPSNASAMKDEQQEASSSNKSNEDECEKERERFMMLEKELDEADQKLLQMKPIKNQRPSEEYLLLESDATIMREEWTRLKKFLEVRDQQKKFKRILESNPNPTSSTSTIKRRGLRTQYMGDPTELTRQTRLIMEDNQIFPIVSMVNPQTGEGGQESESQRGNSESQHQQQPQKSYELVESDEKRQIIERRTAVSPPTRPIQRAPGRGILSRRGPAKSVAKSIRNSIEENTPFTYTTAGSTSALKTTNSATAMTATKTTHTRKNVDTIPVGCPSSKESKLNSPLKIAKSQVPSGIEQSDSKKRNDLTEATRRSTRVSKRPKIEDEQD